MNFWDTSALVPLLVAEPATSKRSDQFRASMTPVVWWGTRLECVSALCRREREGALSKDVFQAAIKRLTMIESMWQIVLPSETVLARAERLLRVHPLRAADAVQLAAALLAAREETRGCTFHTGDERLITAATQEGFEVV